MGQKCAFPALVIGSCQITVESFIRNGTVFSELVDDLLADDLLEAFLPVVAVDDVGRFQLSEIVFIA